MAAPLTGQITTSGTAVPLSATPVNPTAWILKAPATNNAAIYVGGKGVTPANGFPLTPGETMEYDRKPVAGALYDLTPADLYVVGSGGVAAWLAFL